MSVLEAPAKDIRDVKTLASSEVAAARQAAGASNLERGESYVDATFMELSEDVLKNIVYSYDVACQCNSRCSLPGAPTQE
ncbi:hypothetical protein B0H16DRAFT_1741911 [Mycena metata]|uniref:Uncharacterized protein n=1 Tax=Mycena metata TaxID=1033252 RepID=A0AAD7H945_9AGAR|nr:hypothetical protein B0H16DRAFT_1741911 [Mycena metata]